MKKCSLLWRSQHTWCHLAPSLLCLQTVELSGALLNGSSPFLWLLVSQQANICSLWVSILFKVNKGSCVVEELSSVVILHFPNVHWTLWWSVRHTQLVSCCNRLSKVMGALYPHILRISPLSAGKGSVSCGGLLVLWPSRSPPNVMKFNPPILIGVIYCSCTYILFTFQIVYIFYLKASSTTLD